jgi:diguanylate cyclase (GGDEF)-like protein
MIMSSDPMSPGGRAIVREQFRILRAQIPVMYALMLVDAAFLSFATYGTVPRSLSLGVPAALCVATMIRTVVWLRRRHRELPEEQIRRYLRSAIVAASILSFGFGGWGLLLFEQADLVQRTCIGLYIFIGAISCCYCLQSLPVAGRLVLICGAFPMTLRLLLSGDWFLIGLGLNMLFVSGLLLRMLATNYSGFVELLSSRSAITLERERACDAEQLAHQLAYHDPLTGLPNRRALSEELDQIVAGVAGYARAALLIIDLDRFKAVNDVHGHLSGDRLLREVAQRLPELVGPSGRAFRLGGDEFAILLEIGAGEEDSPRRLARRVVLGLSEPFMASELVHHIGASIGIALFPTDADDPETLLRRADIALYRAKESGRNQHRSFEPVMDAEIKRRSTVERELRATIRADGLRPYYQPLTDLATGRTTGFELLARWPRGDGVELGPDEFIPIAEESGLINELMLQLLERGGEDALSWAPDIRLSVNVSPVQLKDPWLSQKILACLARTGLAPHRLTFEITENALISDAENAARVLAALKRHGIRISLDDFGTGYSSLQHLRMLPFDEIKIDRSFVQAMDTDPEALKIVRAIIGLATSLELPVVAEGIESAAAARQLRDLGCASGQGFYFGKPMPAEAALRSLRRNNAPSRADRAMRASGARRQAGLGG